jgi:hypothetical protein
MLKLVEEKDHNNVNHQEKNLGKAEIIWLFLELPRSEMKNNLILDLCKF